MLAKKTRFAAYDNKRKEMVAELEERERAFKKSRVEKDKEERERWHEGERIKEEGRRMREAREKARVEVEEAGVRAEQAAKTAASEEDEPPALGASPQNHASRALRSHLNCNPQAGWTRPFA